MHGVMERLGLSPALLGHPEFQSALVRLSACLLGALYIAMGAATDYYVVDIPYYLTLSALYLASSIGFLVSIARRASWPARVYVGICLDVIAISLAIFITRDAISPFYLLYILLFISAGTRFGKHQLLVASLAAVVAYNLVLLALDEWRRHTFEAAFFLALLILLPLYQYALLRQVQAARAQAEQANRAKGDFLAFMTHELRTPLTGVIGMTELLKGTGLDAEQRDYVAAISSSADVLGALIGDILDLSKIDARQLTLEQIQFDPRQPVREVCGALGQRARAAGLELVCDLDPDLPRQVRGDPLRLRQILFNLVGNAVKFTERGQILVRMQSSRAVDHPDRIRLLLEVIDTGIGIPKAILPRLFEGFRQADESTTRRFGGTGLGTTIARELTLLMGGTIGVESEEGQGSRFWIQIPLPCEGPTVSSAPRGALSGRRVLVCERNAAYREIARAAFERAGAECVAVADLADIAGPGIGATAVDLVVLADHPQGMDWSEAARRITALGTPPERLLPVIYPGYRPRSGPTPSRCLAKPYLAEDLIAAAESLLGGDPQARAVRPAWGGRVEESSPSWITQASVDEGPPTRCRVLVAEDNEIAARVITSFLSKMGVDHWRVADGEAALVEALTGSYGIAIVDLRMPGLDGIDFARRYLAQAPERPMPIVALTANAAADVRQSCLAAGMSAFLSKPVRPDELRRVLTLVSPASPASAIRRLDNRHDQTAD